MLLSISLIIFTSLSVAWILSKIKMPRIIGFMIAGIILGPYLLDMIDPSILDLSTDLRVIALVVILIRAGLSLKIKDIKAVGLQAFLLSLIPASIEMVAIGFIAPLFFDISTLEAFMMGAIVAAVSPAVVVPRMIELIKQKRGTSKKIPQLILGAASMDDIYVIIIFTSFINAYQSHVNLIFTIISIPISILTGALFGLLFGLFLIWLFKKYHMRDTIKVLIIFGFAFLMVSIEKNISSLVPFSGLIGVVSLGITIDRFYEKLAHRLVLKFEKIWVISEMMLFVLIGAVINIHVIPQTGLFVLMLIVIAMCFRMIGVFISLLSFDATKKEKLFIGISYMPKATVQAAIGAIPLSLGVPGGEIILIVAVMSILITAPLGAFLIDYSSPKLLSLDN
jgi:solute carrier family 9B (sodium/hydrogen exchanger), member 1/2